MFVKSLCIFAKDHLTIHTTEKFLRWQEGSSIRIETEKGNYHSDFLFLCNSNEITEDPRTRWMTLRKVRGQILLLPEVEFLSSLEHSLLFGNYLTTNIGTGSVLGASFDEFKWEEEPRTYESISLIQSAKSIFPQWKVYWDEIEKTPEILRTRVSFRCQTQDRRPIFGKLPDADRFSKENPYKKGESHIRKPPSLKYHENIFVLGGLGSRGLTHSLLGAEITVREALQEQNIIEESLWEDFRPERFLLRNWKRGIPIKL